jgi:hypothetical protein
MGRGKIARREGAGVRFKAPVDIGGLLLGASLDGLDDLSGLLQSFVQLFDLPA